MGEPKPFGAYGLREAGESGLELYIRVAAIGSVTVGVFAIGSVVVGAFFRPGGVENADFEEFGFVTVHGVESALTGQKQRFWERIRQIASDSGAVQAQKPLFCRVLTP